MCGLSRASCDRVATMSVMCSGTSTVDAGGLERLGLLGDDRHLGLDVERVVGADLGAEAVLERRDQATAVRVVLGVRRRDEQHVERQVDLVAADLHVALLEHVQQADLDALGQVGQLVDGEDAAVGARDQAEVQGLLVGEVPTLGDLDRVDLADQVGDGGVGGGELLAVAQRAVHPVDRRVVAQLGDQRQRVRRDRGVGVVVDLGTRDDRHPLVEQVDQRADHAGLGLTALAEEDHVVAGQECVLELGEDGVVVAEDLGEQRLAGLDPGGGVAPGSRT